MTQRLQWSIAIPDAGAPNKRPGVDAGWHVLFSFQRPRPRATQAERSAELPVSKYLSVSLSAAMTILTGLPLPAQSVLDIPPRGADNERAVEGGPQRVQIETATPLPDLIRRLESNWKEVETGKAYWIGYTVDMYSIAARKEAAIEPLLALIRTTKSDHTRYGAILTLHLIGIDSRIAGRFIEKFTDKRARAALLSFLPDDDLRDRVMSLLARDPWASDVPVLMNVMKQSHSDCWTVVNGLFRYHLRDVPFHQPVPGELAKRMIRFNQPADFGSDEFLWGILKAMKASAADRLVVEDGLLGTSLWGYSRIGYGGGNAGPKEEEFTKLLNDIAGADQTFSYCDQGNRIQYYVTDGKVYICSALNAKRRWLDWWDNQPPAYKNGFIGAEPGGAANGSQPIHLETNSTSSAAGSRR